MPLSHSKSKQAFSKNIKAEMHAGKPQKQALAIAYSIKRRAPKAHGGEVSMKDSCLNCMAMGGLCVEHSDNGDALLSKDVPMSRKMSEGSLSDEALGRRKYAMGGKIERNDISHPEELNEDMQPQMAMTDAMDFKDRDDVLDPEHDAGSVDEMEDESLSGMALKRRKQRK